MKLCVLGNSHVGSLKRAWDGLKNEFNDVEITFFADRARGLKDLVVAEGRLVAETERLKRSLAFTSGGTAYIDPRYYDSILIYALELKPFFLPTECFYSRQVVEASVRDHLAPTLSMRLLRMVREVYEGPVFMGYVPLLAAQDNLRGDPICRAYISGLRILNHILGRDYNARVIGQPEDTVVNGRNTHIIYSKGSKRLEIGDRYDGEVHPDEDVSHMNDQFGERWLREFFSRSLPPGLRSGSGA